MSRAMIEIESVSKSFGRHRVLENVTLSVPQGATFAFLGRNGQGKTTTIRMMLGLLPADGGTIRIDGLDAQADALEIRRRVGYLAEDQKMFGWMTVKELLRFTGAFYPSWDDDLADRLAGGFELSKKAKVEKLSKGQSVRLGLLLALAHRPQIVILDDPTLGLDPVMRKEFMRDVIEHLQGNGVTVFFSSHLLYEVEPVADVVAILDRGRIVRQESTERLREQVREFIVPLETYDRIGVFPGLLDERRANRSVAVVTEDGEAGRRRLREAGAEYEESGLTLDDIFEAYVVGSRARSRGGRALAMSAATSNGAVGEEAAR